jgi:uncharacterized membrane protein (DUF106 family)
MLALFLFIVFGLGVAFFATQNTGTVHILMGNYLLSGIPMYVIVIASLLLGVLVSWIISAVNDLSAMFTIKGKTTEIKKANKTIEDLREENSILQEKVKQLQKEHDHTKARVGEEHKQNNLEPSFLAGFKRNFG